MKLYDHRGQEIDLDALRTEQAAPTLAGIRSAFHSSVATALTPVRLASLLAAAAEGDAESYLTLAEEMEERDGHYASVLSTRKLAVSGLAVSVEAATDEKADVQLADEVRALVEAPAFGDLLQGLLDALGKGYSAVEIMWDRSGKQWTPSEYIHRDARWFCFDQVSGRELRLRDPSAGIDGLPLAPYKWILHYPKLRAGLPVRGGLARLACAAFMCKSFLVKDWLAFAEVFGMPLRVGRYGPKATADDIRTLIQAVANIGTDAAAVIPDGMRIDFQSATSASSDGKLYQNLAEWLDKQTSKAILGQTMTADDGSSMSQAKVHNEVRKDILQYDALQLGNTLNRYMVRAYVDLNHGPQKVYPRVTLTIDEPEDLKLLAEALAPFIDRGLPVEVSSILDKFGLAEPAKGAAVLRPAGKSSAPPADSPPALNRRARNRQATPTDDIDDMADELLTDWQPVAKPLTDPIVDLANRSTSFEEFKVQLAQLQLDTSPLAERLALALFQARGLGDGQD